MDDFHWMGLVESAIHLLVCPTKSIQIIINKPKDHRLIKTPQWDKACIDFRLNPQKINTYEIKACKCA
jgi:hypothetical protein